MFNYFRIHKLFENGEMSKSFATFSHINGDFVRNPNKCQDIINPRNIGEALEQMELEGKYAIFVASNVSRRERPLSWDEIHAKVAENWRSLEQSGRWVLETNIADCMANLGTIQAKFNDLDKTTLLFKLVQEPEYQKQFLKVYDKLVGYEEHLEKKEFFRYIIDLYENRVYHYISADDFVL